MAARGWWRIGWLAPLTLGLVAAGLAAVSWIDAHRRLDLPAGGAIVFVPEGASLRSVSRRLGDAGVVRYPLNLRLWARWTGRDRQLRSGDFVFRQGLTPLQVLEALGRGADGLHRITIPEGSTVADIAVILEAAGFGGADQFLCLTQDPRFLLQLDLPASGIEGYLYPDTYSFTWSTSPQRILSAMVERYRTEAARLTEQRRAARLSEHETVTLASIIEKETGLPSERPLVAAVFRNRLRVGMRLQADPTAVYGRDTAVVPNAADLDVDSPYNTYLRDGLPPGPICSPGRAALQAALEPAAADYLYFVARGDGSHVFSRTLVEHNEHVRALRRQRNR